MHATDAKTQKIKPDPNFFWRTKVSEAVCKRDWHNERSYLFFNVWKFRTQCAETFTVLLYFWSNHIVDSNQLFTDPKLLVDVSKDVHLVHIYTGKQLKTVWWHTRTSVQIGPLVLHSQVTWNDGSERASQISRDENQHHVHGKEVILA